MVRRLLDRLRHRFNVAAAEVDDLDVHRRAVLGLAVVSNEVAHVHSMLDTLTSAIAGASEALVVDRRTEIVRVGAGEHMDALPFDSLDADGGWDGDESESL